MRLEDPRLHFTPKRIEAMHALGLTDTESLLSYYPLRYEVLNAKNPQDWKEGERLTFSGTVAGSVRMFRYGRRQSVAHFDVMTDVMLIHVSIFNRPWAARLSDGMPITVTGIYKGRQKVTALSYNNKPLSQQPPVTPVYSTRADVSQATIRACLDKVLHNPAVSVGDDTPEVFKRRYRLLERRTALAWMHQPSSLEQVAAAERTLKYEEFLHFFTASELLKNENGTAAYKPPRRIDHARLEQVKKGLPYALTPDQNKSLEEILEDMEKPVVMHRLLQGDVGCGKTVVAGLALFACVSAGLQGVLLAPTELLVHQHLHSLTELLKGQDIVIEALYAGMPTAAQEEIRQRTARGEIDILIGTHSLLSESVSFGKPGLVVVDEQQRFGVEQRRELWRKGGSADFLLMSATPIPRTLASALYGDMDISTIETMPPGRKPVRTVVVQENSFRSVLGEVSQLLAQGRQLYVICAAIDPNEEYHARSVSVITKNLQKLFAGHYVVASMHGGLSSQEKEEVMNAFVMNKVQVLVSTTVVEVGVNVPNATGMIVYDADRFGLSQLHQLRGRIQRGSQQGICWLLSGSTEPAALARLRVLESTQSGFDIAWQDLRLRGPGDILGTRQSGLPEFSLASFEEDTKIIQQAQKDARTVVSDPDNPDFVPLLDASSRQLHPATLE